MTSFNPKFDRAISIIPIAVRLPTLLGSAHEFETSLVCSSHCHLPASRTVASGAGGRDKRSRPDKDDERGGGHAKGSRRHPEKESAAAGREEEDHRGNASRGQRGNGATGT